MAGFRDLLIGNIFIQNMETLDNVETCYIPKKIRVVEKSYGSV